MSISYVFSMFVPIAFCSFLVFSYYDGKKVEKISKELTKKENRKYRKELMDKRDFSWMGTIKLPKSFEFIGSFLAFLVVLFILTLFVSLFFHNL